jgi:hypothetical protein
MIIQWTNPDVECVVHGVDLTGCKVWVSLQQGKTREIDVDDVDVSYADDATTAIAHLTQSQTGTLKTGSVKVQVNWITPEGKRDATYVKEEEVYVNLLEREVSYDE